jgi:peptidyl-prolyl cis-trans isomerase C
MKSSHAPALSRPAAAPEIRINGRLIARDAIDREMQHHPAPSLDTARHQAGLALVVRELLLQRAEALALRATPVEDETHEEALIRMLIERECAAPEPMDADCRRYFNRNPERFRTRDLHEVSHIFFPAPNDDPEARAAARNSARAVLDELEGNPAQFASMARKHSHCPSREQGGHLGLIERGQTAPEFEKALSRLSIGEIARHPLETRYGFHIVLLHHREPGQPLPFEALRSDIAVYLREQAQRRAISQYLWILTGEAEIEGIDLDAAASPLTL